jgi:hypothetical protein
MEYKKISINVPVDAEMFNDTFTPEENYAMIKIGREQIIKQRGLQPILSADSMGKDIKREIREKNRQKYRTRLQELEKQIDAMKRELQKHGVILTPTTA